MSNFGAIQTTDVRSSGITYERHSFDVRTGPRDDFYVVAMLSGQTVVSQGGNDAIAGAGDIYLYNSARPYGHRCDADYHCMSMRTPRPLTQSRLVDVADLEGRVLAAGTSFGRIVKSLIKQAWEIAESSDVGDNSEFSGPIVDMLAAAISCVERWAMRLGLRGNGDC